MPSPAASRAKEVTIGGMSSTASREVMAAGRETIQRTSTRWRRVTDGSPCGFCAMLASRGPVYRSEASAGGGRYHDHCGCTVEPHEGGQGDWEPTDDELRFIEAYEACYEPGMSERELVDLMDKWLAKHGDSTLGTLSDDWARWKVNRDVRIGLTREQREALLQIKIDEEQIASLLARIDAAEESESVLDYLRMTVEDRRRRIAELRGSLPADMGRLDFDPDNPLSIYGNRLVIQDDAEIVAQHLRDLESMPRGFHETLADHFGQQDGSGFYLGDRATPDLDDLGELRGAQPRGWPPGSTWDSVPGAYDPRRRVCACGGGGHGHGGTSLAMHEGSHALDHALGQVSMSSEFVEVFHRVHGTAHMNPYFTYPGNPSGYLSEGFAEGFAAWSKGRAVGASGDDLARAVGDALTNRGSYDVGPMRGLSDYFERLEKSMRRKYSSQTP